MEEKRNFEELRKYLNSLPIEKQHEYARKCQTTVGYLRKAISTKMKIDGALANRLDVFSDGNVKKQLIRPSIWPELFRKEDAA
jgi:hypothetical protein